MVDTAKFDKPIPVDPFSNANYTYAWKNVSVGWRVGICNKKLVNTTEISPGYGVPPYFGDLCSGVNGYFLQVRQHFTIIHERCIDPLLI